MIFDKSATIQWGKGQSFQQMVLGKLDIHVQKENWISMCKRTKLEPYLTPYTKMDSILKT